MEMKTVADFLRRFSLAVRLKRLVWPMDDGVTGKSSLNIVKSFPQFAPYSSGSYKQRSELTIEAINSLMGCLKDLLASLGKLEIRAHPITTAPQTQKEILSAERLRVLFDHYGSDKAAHAYHYLYGKILNDPDAVNRILEVGLGTNQIDVVSNMGPTGKPGASLRAFQEHCINASLFGADVDRRILFEEARIKTFFVDQTRYETFEALRSNIGFCDFDLIIDDGLHSPHANLITLQFSLSALKRGGWLVIEDIGPDSLTIWQVIGTFLSPYYEVHMYFAEPNYVFAVRKS